MLFLFLQVKDVEGLDNSAQIFNALSDVPGDVQDVDQLIDVRHFQKYLIFHF